MRLNILPDALFSQIMHTLYYIIVYKYTMDINEELYRYRKIIYTLEQDYRILTNIYNNLLNNKRVLTKTILINNKIFSLEEYNNILNEISITRENIRITLQNIRIEYNTLLEGN